ncbi:hypothetical protein DRO55_04180, partial [Candidatus Bathyarchaeota archaeon]
MRTLFRKDIDIDPDRYYELELHVKGDRISGLLDGEEQFTIEDGTYTHGKVGIRTNAESRFYGMTVWTDEDSPRGVEDVKRERFLELKKVRRRYPKPVLWRKINVSRFKPKGLRFTDLDGDGRVDMLLLGSSSLSALNVDGGVLWSREEPSEVMTQLYDIDKDGSIEVVCITEDSLTILDGKEGKIKSRINKPDEEIDSIYVANLLGEDTRQVIVKGRKFGIWVYDHKLRPLWSIPEVECGEHIAFHDLNGDGREEIYIGYKLLDGYGNTIWEIEPPSMRIRPYIANSIIMGDLDGTKPKLFIASGYLGLLILNEEGSIERRIPLGYISTMTAGKFRRDLPGLQVWTCGGWGAHGIRTLLDHKGNKLFEFEPDNNWGAGAPTNWTGDGEELAFHASSEDCMGLYDSFGRRVVEFPDDGHPCPSETYGYAIDIIGDERDELILANEDEVYIYTQSEPFYGPKIYAPIRKWWQQSGGYLSIP